jgi:RimJ/RimL family protein N-acetyltransferase
LNTASTAEKKMTTLAPYHPDYLELISGWRKDAVVRLYNPIDDLSPEALHRRFSSAASNFSVFHHAELFFWIIWAAEKPVGNISIKHISNRMLIAEIGYGIAPEARGNGYATEAVRLVTQRAFKESPLRKLIAYVHEENMASRRVLEKVGYQREGVLREHYIVEGVAVNEVVYGLLKREMAQ